MTHKAIDWGDIEHLQNKQGKSLYKDVTIIWSRPRVWKRGESAPTDLAEEQPGYLYCLVRNLRWTIWPEFNDRKAYSLPGIGSQPARAWRIYNAGYRFSGTMPIEIVYPWMLIKPGRDRSAKPS